MNRKEWKEKLPLIEAFVEGKTVEYNFLKTGWGVLLNPDFKSPIEKYRIKPEAKLVPFTFEDGDLFKDKWIRNKKSGILYKINIIGKKHLGTEEGAHSYDTFLKEFEFEDGSPCGKYTEENEN